MIPYILLRIRLTISGARFSMWCVYSTIHTLYASYKTFQLMRLCFILIFLLATTADIFPQIRITAPISKVDSIALDNFWNSFRNSIQQRDKQKLASLFKFPFYCHQCLDYVHANDSYNATVKVSKKLFLDSVYKLFFDIPGLNKLTSNIWSDTIFLHKIEEKNVKSSWKFSYAIIAPTKEYEGTQGFVYLRKRKGQYIIDGLDTVP